MNEEDREIMGSRIRERRLEKRLSQEQLAEKLGMKRPNVAGYEAGRIIPPGNVMRELADILDCTTDYLLGRDKSPIDLDNVRRMINSQDLEMLPVDDLTYLPIIAEISCGIPLYTEDNVVGSFPVDRSMVNVKSGQYVWLRAKGDSMVDANINDGSLVLVRVQPEVEEGDVAAVCIDDETATLKRVFFQEGFVLLVPENSKMKPMSYPRSRVRIVGKAVQAITCL
jgi:repressor LexA